MVGNEGKTVYGRGNDRRDARFNPVYIYSGPGGFLVFGTFGKETF
jgi:hypothetical protein